MKTALEIIEARISSEVKTHVVDLTDADVLDRHKSDFGVDYDLDVYNLSIRLSFFDDQLKDSDAHVLINDRYMQFHVFDNMRVFTIPAGGRKRFDVYAAYRKLLATLADYERAKAQFEARNEIKVNGLVFKKQASADQNSLIYRLNDLPQHVEAEIRIELDTNTDWIDHYAGDLNRVWVTIANGSKDDVRFAINCGAGRCDYFNYNQKLAAELRKYKHRINNVLSSIDSPLEIKLDMGALHKHATIEKDTTTVMRDVEKLLSNHGITLEVQRHG